MVEQMVPSTMEQMVPSTMILCRKCLAKNDLFSRLALPFRLSGPNRRARIKTPLTPRIPQTEFGGLLAGLLAEHRDGIASLIRAVRFCCAVIVRSIPGGSFLAMDEIPI